MAYSNKPGFGNLFQNTKKKSDKEPAMRGEVMTPDGKLYEIAGWSKQDKNGAKFLSLKMQEPRAKSDAEPAQQPKQSGAEMIGEDIPF